MSDRMDGYEGEVGATASPQPCHSGFAPSQSALSRPFGECQAQGERAMKFAYADPPYLGRGEYYRAHHPDAMAWNKPETHQALIERLQAEFPDGWAMSLSERSLRTLLPMCPPAARVCAWITASPRYAGNTEPVRRHFEPVIFMGGRSFSDTGNRAADYIVTKQQRLPEGEPRYAMVKEDIRAGKTFVGRKPAAFSFWMFDLLGLMPEDEFVDLFPGSGAVQAAYRAWLEGRTGEPQGGLFGEAA